MQGDLGMTAHDGSCLYGWLTAGRKPLAFELPQSALTGIGQFDEDHRRLISLINVIAGAEQIANTTALVDG
jgi:hypothetical protein